MIFQSHILTKFILYIIQIQLNRKVLQYVHRAEFFEIF